MGAGGGGGAGRGRDQGWSAERGRGRGRGRLEGPAAAGKLAGGNRAQRERSKKIWDWCQVVYSPSLVISDVE